MSEENQNSLFLTIGDLNITHLRIEKCKKPKYFNKFYSVSLLAKLTCRDFRQVNRIKIYNNFEQIKIEDFIESTIEMLNKGEL